MSEQQEKLITIEFTNLARSIVGETRIQLSLPAETTYGEIVTRLAEMFPDMIGIIIAEDKKSLLNSNLFIINGEMSQPAFIMDESPGEDDVLTIVSVATGG